MSGSGIIKRCSALILILLLASTAFSTGCNNQLPPVTDCDSLIKNLRHAGATVNITHTEYNATSFAESYVNFHYEVIESVQKSGKVIEPEFLEAELNRLGNIQEQTDGIEVTRTEITLNIATAQIREYNGEKAADSDAAYVALIKDLELTIPTDKGEEYVIISPLAVKLNAYKKGSIIVEYLVGYLSLSEDESILELLESVLGPPFYVEN